ncbi:MAG: heme exporter protein CcmD [Gammaproteobacteria bacterium]|nr:heme exporter protein CcmD [Gammaproteobacteria bacterium]
MGGYAAFVWSCAGLSFAVLAGLMLTARRRLRGVRGRIRQRNAAPDEGSWELRA